MSIQNDKIMNLQDGQVLYNDLRDRIEDTKLNATLSTPTPIVSFSDGAPYPMNMQFAVEPVQDLHGYDHPWPAGGGKNLYSGAATIDKDDSSIYYNVQINPIQCPATLTFSAQITSESSAVRVAFRDANGGAIESFGISTGSSRTSATVTISSEATIERIYLYGATSTATAAAAKYTNIQIESGSTATDYVPYSNICPISGFDWANVTVTGKNLLNFQSYTGTGVWLPSYVFPVLSPYLHRKVTFSGQGQYTFRLYGIKNGVETALDASEYSASMKEDKLVSQYDHIRVNGYSNNASNVFSDCFIGFSDSSDEIPYEPFGTIYPITFPTSAGTVYGGTVTVNPDGTGKLIMDHGLIELDGSNDETYTAQQNQTTAGRYRFATTIPNAAPVWSATLNEGKSNYLYANNNRAYGANDNAFAIANGNILYISILGITTVEGLRSYLAQNVLQIYYPFVTNLTYTLTPEQVLSLIGKNNVWADTGNIQFLSYVRQTVPELIRQDTAGQIAAAVNPVESSLAIVVDGDTAPKNITSGQYVYVKNHSTLATGMYHATTAIASGASISNSNIMADEEGGLNSLFNGIQYITTGLTALKCTITAGGYYKIGNLVIINIRIKPNTNNDISNVDGFPPYSTLAAASHNNKNFVALSVSDAYRDGVSDIPCHAYLSRMGRICLNLSSNYMGDDEYVLSGIYICD